MVGDIANPGVALAQAIGGLGAFEFDAVIATAVECGETIPANAVLRKSVVAAAGRHAVKYAVDGCEAVLERLLGGDVGCEQRQLIGILPLL